MTTNEKSDKAWIAGVFAALAASLCCITPVLAVLGGLGGVAASFSWLDPARPYLMGFTGIVFGFAWYQKLKPKKADVDCDCEEDEKPSFLHSRTFLGIVTVIAGLLMAFPYYSGAFFPESKADVVVVDESNIILAKLSIEGMTCDGCEHSVNFALNETEGVIEASSSYVDGSANVKFDRSKISIEDVALAVTEMTGYKVTGYEFIN